MTRPEPPSGFKRYPAIMLPSGSVVEPASCWLLTVDVFEEREVEAAVRDGHRTLTQIAETAGGRWLAPELRSAAEIRAAAYRDLADAVPALGRQIGADATPQQALAAVAAWCRAQAGD